MTFLEAFRLMNAEQFERYGRDFFNARDKEKALRDLQSDFPKDAEKPLLKVLGLYSTSSAGKQ
ncbi:hypothetical protein [Peptoniphilus indolicus]|uniref:Uncharacterized protein n=2 Tax=Peptoniphilus indolicus TaxID=33030 RepID=G4D5K4_9FIRM|nr:hypothetical protein [Peptoniphilus indolicus]EGY78670.1 hypothetical protein HMPREF9129_1684 [Peptoniphilus indolicus ATCC 29427]SUB74423.1 Uncharacterised protein [Peptoniphilus indolicus]